jgi:hypothetical protein
VVGVRLGAALAAGTRAEGVSVQSLVLWDPVVDGAAYNALLAQMHRACLSDTLRFRKPQLDRLAEGERLGFRWPVRLEESIAPLNLLNRPFPYENCFLATSEENAEIESLKHSLERNTRGRVTYEFVPEPAGWGDHRQVESALSANRMVAAIVNKIADGFV